MQKLLLLACVLGSFLPAQAGLLFVFSTTDGSISRNGVSFSPESFTVEALVTAPLQPGVGFAGGDRYAVDTLWLSWPSQGLNRVVSNSSFNVLIGLPNIGAPSAVVPQSGAQIAGVLNYPSLNLWDRFTALPIANGLAGVASASFIFNLVNGASIGIASFDVANGGNEASLRVDLVPEPASFLTVGSAAFVLFALRRRKASR